MPSADVLPQTGLLLLAPPALEEPNFRRAVILLCEHNAAGSFGLVLNRPLDIEGGEVMDELLPYEEPLGLGGPVQPNTLHYVHRFDEEAVPGAICVTEGVFWGGRFEAVQALMEAGTATARDLRFFLGYAGWSPGQLAAEIEAGGWIAARADERAVFPDDPSALWRTTLRRMGGEYALLANFPDDPRMN